MDILARLLQQSGFAHLTWGNWVMFLVGGILIYLAIAKKY
jgi:Na+-transporting methylmalonyl-CoA/oxaloacetate decarboxylase beta subunit